MPLALHVGLNMAAVPGGVRRMCVKPQPFQIHSLAHQIDDEPSWEVMAV